MKKLTCLFLALSAPSALAMPYFTGFYAHLGLGGSLADFDVDQKAYNPEPGTVMIFVPDQVNLQDVGFTGLLGLGYSHQFSNHFVLGAEVTAGNTDAEVSTRDKVSIAGNIIDGHIKAKLKNDFAILFKPGYVIRDKTQIYAFVGPRWANFETSLHTQLVISNTSDKTSGYELGITAGLGMQHLITENLSLGLEYYYTSYGSIQSPNTMDVIFTGTFIDVIDDVDIDASSNTILIDLTYHF